jgi:hypothetical protein
VGVKAIRASGRNACANKPDMRLEKYVEESKVDAVRQVT